MSEEESKPETAEPQPAEAGASPSSSGAPEPAKAKKKKKKAKAEADVAPSDPRAAELTTAFDAGDFVRVRELATALAKSDEPVLASIGKDYLARIAVDPVQIAFLGLCALAILTIAWIYVPH